MGYVWQPRAIHVICTSSWRAHLPTELHGGIGKNIIIPVHWWERGLGAKKRQIYHHRPYAFSLFQLLCFQRFEKYFHRRPWIGGGLIKESIIILGSIKEAIINEPLNYILSRKGDVLYIYRLSWYFRCNLIFYEMQWKEKLEANYFLKIKTQRHKI